MKKLSKSKKKNVKVPIYLRYEFSNESGKPEGADIFEIASMKKVQELTTEILKVAHGDGVTVNLIIGEKKSFFGYLRKAGVNMVAAEKEIVALEEQPEKTANKKTKSRK